MFDAKTTTNLALTEILQEMRRQKNAKPLVKIEVEAWGESLHIPVPPQAKGKRVRVTLETI